MLHVVLLLQLCHVSLCVGDIDSLRRCRLINTKSTQKNSRTKACVPLKDVVVVVIVVVVVVVVVFAVVVVIIVGVVDSISNSIIVAVVVIIIIVIMKLSQLAVVTNSSRHMSRSPLKCQF